MEVSTKYSVGDKVYQMHCVESLPHTEICPVCNGKVYIEINGNKFKCTNCINGAVTIYPKPQMYVERTIVGKVQVEIEKRRDVPEISYKTSYMTELTGVGSGRVLSENDLYSTAEECQAACDEVNKANNDDSC